MNLLATMKLDSKLFPILITTVISILLPAFSFGTQSAHAQTGNSDQDVYRNDATGLCMNVAGPGQSNYLNRKVVQYQCSGYVDPEQIFVSDPQRDPYKLLRFGGNRNLCWNTINGTTDGVTPFLYNCTWGDSGQMIDYERSIRRLQMSGKGFCIQADAGGNYAPVRLRRCSDSPYQKWTIRKW
jgi:hypothetical protein